MQLIRLISKITILFFIIANNANAYDWVLGACAGPGTPQSAAQNVCNGIFETADARMVAPGATCPSPEVPNTNMLIECRMVRFVSGYPNGETPPTSCAGNPVEIGTGFKYQTEVDISSKGEGQVSFARYYSNAESGQRVLWNHNYESRIEVLDPAITSRFKAKSREYSTKRSACLSGWGDVQRQLTQSWAPTATAEFSESDGCKIKNNGQNAKTLPIVPVNDNDIAPASAVIKRPNGSTITFESYDGVMFKPIDGTSDLLMRTNNGVIMWSYSYNNYHTTEDYDAAGKLLFISDTSTNSRQTLTYDPVSGLLMQVKDLTGRKLTFTYNGYRLSSVTTDNNKVTRYTYDSLTGLMKDVQRPNNAHRLYHYEDVRFPDYLTGITDERGVRFATWTYDAKGHAVSSEHAGSAEKKLLTFNADGSTTVTNELNKKTIYRFAFIAGSLRVTSVEGQPTANCIGANQNYTYTNDGRIASKTDWNGNKTTYLYNAFGQETSRTEAFGTTAARTIKTEWNPSLNKIAKITGPETETTFNYDTNGLLLNQTARSLIAP